MSKHPETPLLLQHRPRVPHAESGAIRGAPLPAGGLQQGAAALLSR